MAFKVIDPKDQSTFSDANSYVSVADANVYVTDRGYTTVLTEGLLIRGADYVNSFRDRFSGEKRTPASSNMQFPRTDAILDNDELPTDEIPNLIIEAQIETALEIANNRDPQETVTSQLIKKEKVGDLEVEYDNKYGDTSASGSYDYRKISNLLQPILTDDWTRVYR